MKSPIKWAGGKGKLIEVIKSVLPPPSECQRLIEPFVGGANVFLNTEYKEYILGDANGDLINLYKWIQIYSERVIMELLMLWDDHSEAGYYAIRNTFNNTPNGSRKAAMFIYLNRHAFNGLC